MSSPTPPTPTRPSSTSPPPSSDDEGAAPRRPPPPGPPAVASSSRTTLTRGVRLSHLDEYAEAELKFRAALQRAIESGDNFDITHRKYWLGQCLHQLEKYAEAEPLLKAMLKHETNRNYRRESYRESGIAHASFWLRSCQFSLGKEAEALPLMTTAQDYYQRIGNRTLAKLCIELVCTMALDRL